MRQSSEHFMDEMLKDNSARTDPSDQFEQLAKVIDDKIDSAMNRMMEKFNSQVSQVNEPEEDDESSEKVETPEPKEKRGTDLLDELLEEYDEKEGE